MARQLFLGKNQSPAITVVGVLVAAVAVVGTQLLGWEWGSGQLIPTMIGVAVAAFAIVTVVSKRVGLSE
ncbi:multidrug transporter [Halovenus halobia]|uniref:multidrug transporter n=1 Tax=Halovenus halobia TaxID=3396622 RepID=UPI003F5780FB